MTFIHAKEHLQKYRLENNIIEFETSSATVKDASEVLHCEEKEIAKSLGFLVNDNPILIVMSGDCKIDNGKFKNQFKEKAKMIPFLEVEEKIGHKVGGVCPFGVQKNVLVFLDESLKRFSTVYPACGSHNSAVKLSLEELILASEYKEWVDVCKNIE